jgi:phage terminase large subunit-like protein
MQADQADSNCPGREEKQIRSADGRSLAGMTDIVTQYALDVLANRITVGEFKNVQMGKLHKLACQRHLNDLKRQNTAAFPYHYEPERAAHILRFAECLTMSEGFGKQPLKLLDCQKFDLGCTFGWVKNSTNRRRFRRRYKSIARQNGKSMENGIQGVYISHFSGYQEGKLFTAATKRRQSKIAWEEMAKFIRADDELADFFNIKDYASMIVDKVTGCTIEALSKEGGIDDGFRPIYASIDELHQMKDNSVYKAARNGSRSLDETLISMISTRGFDLNSFCKEIDDYAIKVLEGLTSAEDFFVDVYALDDGDDYWEPRNWIKSNPYVCSRPTRLETMKEDAATAKAMQGAELRDFITKSLNLWAVNTDLKFVNVDQWKACAVPDTLSDYAGCRCWAGIDFSSGGDLTSIHLEVERPDGESFNWSHSFMPMGRLHEHIKTDMAPYDIWRESGQISVTGGMSDYKNDYKFAIAKLKEVLESNELKLQAIGIDPHNADGILSDLEDFGVPIIMVTQSARNLNDATAEIQLDIKSGKYKWGQGLELMSWSFVNANVVYNSFKEMKVDKEPHARNRRIDPVDAAVDARFAKLKTKEEDTVSFEDSMDRYLSAMGWS